MPVLFSSPQTSSVPANSVAAAPKTGSRRNTNPIPIPGKARCETTSAASVMRFNKAKLPTSPAAIAAASAALNS